MIQFDEHIFQRGWFKHQPVNFTLKFRNGFQWISSRNETNLQYLPRICVYAKSYWDNWQSCDQKANGIFFSAHHKAPGPNASPEGCWGYGPMGRGFLMLGLLKAFVFTKKSTWDLPPDLKNAFKELRKREVCIWDKPSLHWNGEYVVPLYLFFIQCFVGIEKSWMFTFPSATTKNQWSLLWYTTCRLASISGVPKFGGSRGQKSKYI